MSLGLPEAEKRGVPNPEDLINLQQSHYFMKGRPNSNFNSKDASSSPFVAATNRIPYYAASAHHLHLQERRKVEYTRSLSQGTARRLLPAASYLGLLLCLAASLLILPLILPPLPPPPLMLLLLLPVGILAMLMVLAFMPSNETKDITTHAYM